MDTINKTIDRFNIWALLGPLAAAATTLLVLTRAASGYLPLILLALVGVLISWHWRLRGFIIASASIILITIIQIDFFSATSLIWHLGITSSLILAFLLTALSYDEWQTQNTSTPIPPTQSIEDQTSRVKEFEENLQTAQAQWDSERNEFLEKLKTNAAIINDREASISTYKLTLERMRVELDATRARQDSLEADLCDQRQEVRLANKKLETAQKEFRDLEIAKEQNAAEILRLGNLKHELQKREEATPDLQRMLNLSQDEVRTAYNLLEISKQETAALLQVKEQIHSEQMQKGQLQELLSLSHLEIQQLQNQLAALKTEIETLLSLKKQLAAEQLNHANLLNEIQKRDEQIASLAVQLSLNEKQIVDLSSSILEHANALEKLKADKDLILLSHQNSALELKQKIIELDKEKGAQELVLASLHKDLENIKQERDALLQKLEENRLDRRKEGMFQQLREQFAEKSHQLDSARQELFQSQEKYLAFQRDWEEETLLDRTDIQEALERHLSQMDKEYTALKYEHEKEVNDLQELITKLCDT